MPNSAMQGLLTVFFLLGLTELAASQSLLGNAGQSLGEALGFAGDGSDEEGAQDDESSSDEDFEEDDDDVDDDDD